MDNHVNKAITDDFSDLWSVNALLEGTGLSEEERKAPANRIKYALASRKWYEEKKNVSKWWALSLLILAAMFTSAAGIIPVLSQMSVVGNWAIQIDPAWSAIMLALAALMVSANSLANNSNNWTRNSKAQMLLEGRIMDLVGDIQRITASGSAPNVREMELAAVYSQFSDSVSGIVINETDQWGRQSSSAYRDVVEQVDTGVDRHRLGTLSVVMTNGADFDDGWTLMVKGEKERRIMSFSGDRGEMEDLRSGSYQVSASAEKNGGKYETPKVDIEIRANGTHELKLSLQPVADDKVTPTPTEPQPLSNDDKPPNGAGARSAEPPTEGKAKFEKGAEAPDDEDSSRPDVVRNNASKPTQ